MCHCETRQSRGFSPRAWQSQACMVEIASSGCPKFTHCHSGGAYKGDEESGGVVRPGNYPTPSAGSGQALRFFASLQNDSFGQPLTLSFYSQPRLNRTPECGNVSFWLESKCHCEESFTSEGRRSNLYDASLRLPRALKCPRNDVFRRVFCIN